MPALDTGGADGAHRPSAGIPKRSDSAADRFLLPRPATWHLRALLRSGDALAAACAVGAALWMWSAADGIRFTPSDVTPLYASSVEDVAAKLEYDLYYIKHQSLWLDAEIAWRTLWTVATLSGR